VYYGQLGQYPKGHFTNTEVRKALAQFQAALQRAGEVIQDRNVGRVAAWEGHISDALALHWNYTTLSPRNIPQSINI